MVDKERTDKTMDINEKFRELAQYKLMLEETKKEVETIEAEIKAYMEESGKDELIGDEHKATWREYQERRFDSTAFKKDHADMYEAYRVSQTKRPFKFA